MSTAIAPHPQQPEDVKKPLPTAHAPSTAAGTSSTAAVGTTVETDLDPNAVILYSDENYQTEVRRFTHMGAVTFDAPGQAVLSLKVGRNFQIMLQFDSVRYPDPTTVHNFPFIRLPPGWLPQPTPGTVTIKFGAGKYSSLMDFVSLETSSESTAGPALIKQAFILPAIDPSAESLPQRTSIYSPEWAEGTTQLNDFRLALTELYSYGQEASTWTPKANAVPKKSVSGHQDGEWLSEYDLTFADVARIHGYPLDTDHTFPNSDPRSLRCAHGIVQFPPWHRRYMLIYEQALRQAYKKLGKDFPGLPYWDWASVNASKDNAIPPCCREFEFRNLETGQMQPNPLYGAPVPDSIANVQNMAQPVPQNILSKYGSWFGARYMTVRPTSGGVPFKDQILSGTNLSIRIARCTYLPNYLAFATTADRDVWGNFVNNESLEQPHNTVHVYTGGALIDNPPPGNMSYLGPAAWDPIFFFHHSFVDRVYAMWQLSNPGINSNLKQYDDELRPSLEGTSLSTQPLNMPPWAGPEPNITDSGNTWLEDASNLTDKMKYSPYTLDLPLTVSFQPASSTELGAEEAGAAAAAATGGAVQPEAMAAAQPEAGEEGPVKGVPLYSHNRMIRLNEDQSLWRPNTVEDVEAVRYWATKQHKREHTLSHHRVHHRVMFNARPGDQGNASDEVLNLAGQALQEHEVYRAANANAGAGADGPVALAAASSGGVVGDPMLGHHRWHLQAVFVNLPKFALGGSFVIQALDTEQENTVVGAAGFFTPQNAEECSTCRHTGSKVSDYIDLGRVDNPFTDRSKPLSRYKFRVICKRGILPWSETGFPQPTLFYKEYNVHLSF